MPIQNAPVSSGEVLRAVCLTSFVVLVLLGFQTTQTLVDREALQQMVTQQDKPLEEARKLQVQFTALALGTKKLADGGDKDAAAIVARIEQLGMKFGEPPQAGQVPNAPPPPSAPANP